MKIKLFAAIQSGQNIEEAEHYKSGNQTITKIGLSLYGV